MSTPTRYRWKYIWIWPGLAFGRFADLVQLLSIRIFGEPSEKAIELLEDKLRLLGFASCDMPSSDVGPRVPHRPV